MKFKLGILNKLPKAVILGLAGIVLGHIVGVLFTDIGVASNILWEQILIFLGGISGLILGFADEEE